MSNPIKSIKYTVVSTTRNGKEHRFITSDIMTTDENGGSVLVCLNCAVGRMVFKEFTHAIHKTTFNPRMLIGKSDKLVALYHCDLCGAGAMIKEDMHKYHQNHLKDGV